VFFDTYENHNEEECFNLKPCPSKYWEFVKIVIVKEDIMEILKVIFIRADRENIKRRLKRVAV
jgi:hypothetical protein